MKVRGIIPEKVVPILRRVYRWLMTDAGVFLILGLTFFSKGVIYFTQDAPPFSEHVIEIVAPRSVLGPSYIAFGILLLLGCFIKNTYYQAALIGLTVGILMMWGFEFFRYEDALFMQYGVNYVALSAMTLITITRGRDGYIRISKTSDPPLEIMTASQNDSEFLKGETNGD